MKESIFSSQNILQCSRFLSRDIFWETSYLNMLPFTIVSLVSIVSFTIKGERIFNETKLNGYKEIRSECFYEWIGRKTGSIHMKWLQIKILNSLNKTFQLPSVKEQLSKACVNKNFKSQFGIKVREEQFFCRILNGNMKSTPKKPGEEYRTAGHLSFPFILCLFYLCFPFESLFSGRGFLPLFPHSSKVISSSLDFF